MLDFRRVLREGMACSALAATTVGGKHALIDVPHVYSELLTSEAGYVTETFILLEITKGYSMNNPMTDVDSNTSATK